MVDSNNALSLKFVPEKINSAILSEGEFLDKGIYIKKSEIKDSNDQPYYICKITRAKHSYIGLVNPLFQRENLGVNKYDNGDYYVGYWVNNTKDYKGLFVYCPPISKVNQSNEIYLGDWVSNKREGFGMYALVEEPMNNEEFEHCSMQLFLGDFVDNQMSHGVYLLKEGDDCYAYFGEFVNGKKQDNCALFYDNPKETVFRGKVANDQFESGIYTTFDEEDNINAFYYVEYEGGKATSYMKGQDLETSIVGKIKTQSEKFRHIMLDTDWFGNSYRLIKDIVKSIKGLDSIDNFNSKDALKIIDHILHKHEQLELYKILIEEAQ